MYSLSGMIPTHGFGCECYKLLRIKPLAFRNKRLSNDRKLGFHLDFHLDFQDQVRSSGVPWSTTAVPICTCQTVELPLLSRHRQLRPRWTPRCWHGRWTTHGKPMGNPRKTFGKPMQILFIALPPTWRPKHIFCDFGAFMASHGASCVLSPVYHQSITSLSPGVMAWRGFWSEDQRNCHQVEEKRLERSICKACQSSQTSPGQSCPMVPKPPLLWVCLKIGLS